MTTSLGRFPASAAEDWGRAFARARPMRRRDLIVLLGGTVALPRAVRAQQKATPVVGYLGLTAPAPMAQLLTAFHQGLGETGYIEGHNVVLEYRWAEGR